MPAYLSFLLGLVLASLLERGEANASAGGEGAPMGSAKETCVVEVVEVAPYGRLGNPHLIDEFREWDEPSLPDDVCQLLASFFRNHADPYNPN